MAFSPGYLRRGFMVCVAIGAALGTLFGLALMARSLTGKIFSFEKWWYTRVRG